MYAIARSTRAFFFACGMAVAGWAPLVPIVKERAHLGDDQLGILLLFLGLGGFVGMPAAGYIGGRIGGKLPVLIACSACALALTSLAWATQPWLIAALLFIFGAGIGANDVLLNHQAHVVERTARRPMMSGFHGMWSLGGMIGAAMVSAMLALGVTVQHATALMAVLVAVIMTADSTPSGHPVRSHLARHSRAIWPPVPRPSGRAVGAQRRRGGIVSPGWLASSISASVCALIHPSD
ncbi:MFS transporter [Pseudomonas putida]